MKKRCSPLTPSNIRRSIGRLCGVMLIAGLGSSDRPARAVEIDFSRQIRPILSDNCFQCHGPDAEHREADLRLDTRDGLLGEQPGDGVVVPEDLEASELMVRVSSDDPGMKMPPPDSGKELSDEEIDLLRQWIAQGAQWQQHWAFVPPRRPAVPDVKASTWPRNAIDHFVLARLQSTGLQPQPEADRRTLIRRLSLDLTGLPPTRAQVHQFLQDTAPDAYERLVDRLLDSDHFGERMALAWLDQARYADTNGYSIDGGRHMWLWRDWVIDAYNRNLPFDQFVTQQLAGDLLPDPTPEQLVATGFNRNHMITHEGGTIPEENLTNYVVDRVKTTSEVFLGLTMACAQCHEHKYDPLSQKDYYRFFAYFNTLGDRGLDGDGGRNAVPKIQAYSVFAGNAQEVEQLEQQLTRLHEQLQEPLPSQAAWEEAARQQLAHRGQNLQLHPVEVLKVTSPNRGSAYEVLPDGTIYVPHASGRSPSISAQIDVDQVTGLRIEFLPDAQFPQQGLGHGNDRGFPGSFILTSFSMSATELPSDQVDLYKLVSLERATASQSHPDYLPQDCLDPRDHNGWSPHPHNQQAQHITFTFDQPLHASQTPYITVMLVWGGGQFGGGAGLVAGKYRVYAITGNDDGTNLPAEIQQILQQPAEQRTADQQQRLQDYYATVAPELRNVRYQIQNLEQRLQHLTQPHEVMVMDTAPTPRETFILNRGQYDQPTERVTPGTPASLPPLPDGAPANRLGLAQWLVQPAHPLTSRVTVNRLWQLFFGTGIVATSADFGSQGDPPSHPDLLDWLAVDFVESGWDVKAMIKQIVMSATYRQASTVTAETARQDPRNRLLARGPRFRLPAEFIRDATLQISGLLVDRLGGPSVHPYQPPGLWREVSHFGSTPATAQVFVQDHGENLYRRSMYTYWKRTVPPPSMAIFDAPNREICTMERSSTTTPLQALVLLNDPQFVEASRAFAQRILLERPAADTAERLRYAFETATSRLPTDAELEILRRTFRRELDRYRQDPDAARQLLQVGESDRDLRLDPVEHAAWASVARLILNLSETITRG